MGFRNPLTSAVAVDTGQPAGAGVRVYQSSSAQGVSGTVEFRDGISGDTPSTVTASAVLVPQGGGYAAQGGGMSVAAGSWNGLTGPRLDLNVEAAPAGGYRTAAVLSGASRVSLSGPVTVGSVIAGAGSTIQGLAPLLGTAGLFTATTDANGIVTIIHNLGVVPAAVLLTPGDGPVRNLADPIVISRTATQVQVLVLRRDNNTALANNPVTIWWAAIVPAT